jgi:hypothetical protein
MIKRDSHGIIVQHAERGTDDPSYMDGGDSASRTGIMALCGSYADIVRLEDFFIYFDKRYMPVRHPHQNAYNHPKSMSRDQIICLAAGFYRNFGVRSILYTSFKGWYETQRGWFINKDILLPSHWFHIYCCCNSDRNADLVTILFRYISAVFLFFDVLWSTKIKPWDEQNQILCILIVRGKKWLKFYCKLHPDWQKATMRYWDSWRDQKEIGLALIDLVKKELK